MLKIVSYLLSTYIIFTAIGMDKNKLPVNSCSQLPILYHQLLPADIIPFISQYLIRNGQNISDIMGLVSLYTDYNLPARKACIEEIKSFLKLSNFYKIFDHIYSPLEIPDVNQPTYFNDLLLKSVLTRNINLTKIFLFIGSDIEYANPKDGYGINKSTPTLLCRAAESGYIDMVTLLLESGANPNPHKPTQDNVGKPILASPLICALSGNTRNTSAIVKLLLDAGAEKNLPDARNQTPSSFLAAHPHFENAKKARELLEKNYKKR